jgi:hypothetical protein
VTLTPTYRSPRLPGLWTVAHVDSHRVNPCRRTVRHVGASLTAGAWRRSLQMAGRRLRPALRTAATLGALEDWNASLAGTTQARNAALEQLSLETAVRPGACGTPQSGAGRGDVEDHAVRQTAKQRWRAPAPAASRAAERTWPQRLHHTPFLRSCQRARSAGERREKMAIHISSLPSGGEGPVQRTISGHQGGACASSPSGITQLGDDRSPFRVICLASVERER